MNLEIKNEKPRLGEGIFSVSDIAGILKIKPTRSRYLINEYLGNKFKKEQNFNYKIQKVKTDTVNFYALIEIFVFDRLRKINVPSKKITKFHNYLSKKFDTKYPFAITNFIANGKELYFDFKGKWVTGDGTEQIAFKEIIDFLGDKIDYDKESNIASRYFPLGKNKNIVIDPNYRFGKPILKDTNLIVENIYDLYLAEGKNKDFISNLYNLPIEDVNDVIDYMAA